MNKTTTLSIAVIALLTGAFFIFSQTEIKEMVSFGTSLETGRPLASARSSIYDPARVTIKPFGVYSSPGNSPLANDRFTGYHSATDYEIFPGEENFDIPVPVICDGKLRYKASTQGYGGVAVQECTIDNQAVTVIYGHIKLSGVSKNIGEIYKKGEIISILGKGNSAETDGERKHLHLGIHKGSGHNILGYVQNESDLAEWLNPEEVLKSL